MAELTATVWIGTALAAIALAVAGWRVAVLAKRRRRGLFSEYGFQVKTFHLEHDGDVQYAQWLHPKEVPKSIEQAQVNALRKFIRSGDTVIDIGAHTGDTTIPFALAAGPGGCTLALEPNPYVFKVLAKNATLNRAKTNIVPFNFAATETDGVFTFHYSDGAYCNGGFLDQIQNKRHGHRQRLDVHGRNLEKFLRREYGGVLSRLAMVKVDTEGYDRQVLQSILGLVREFQPVIVCEVYRRLTQSEREALFDLISQAGYECYQYAGAVTFVGDHVTRDDLMKSPHFDMVALPRRLRQAAA